jgi:hypothetical protein
LPACAHLRAGPCECRKATRCSPYGSFIFEPAFGHHYDQAKDEEVIVQIMGPGPVKSVQLEKSGAGAGDQK